MRKNVFGRRFKRDKDERTALFKALISSLVLKEKIKTTEAKAKAIRSDAEKAVTAALKNEDLLRKKFGKLLNPQAINKLLKEIAPRFRERHGGYTRIIKLGKRFGDDAMEVVMEWTEGPLPAEPQVKSKKSKVKSKSEKSKVQTKKRTQKK